MNKSFCAGIIGGMGPLAGVELQRLIIEATPAQSDQDHIPVLALTNPSIPDRTRSLAEDDGDDFTSAVIKSGQILERSSATILAMPCMTAHSRHREIQSQLTTPLMNAISLTTSELSSSFPNKKIALFATDGTVKSGVFTTSPEGRTLTWMLPSAYQQSQIMKVIYGIKARGTEGATQKLMPIMNELAENGAEVFVLGCTELGLLYTDLAPSKFVIVDPMRLLARGIVQMHAEHLDAQNATHRTGALT